MGSPAPGRHSHLSPMPEMEPIWSQPGPEAPICSLLSGLGVRGSRGVKGGQGALSSQLWPRPLWPPWEMAPLVVWGRLVCLYLKFPDSEFDVRAGLLVGGLTGRLSPHECTWLSASPGEHGAQDRAGYRTTGCRTPSLGIEVTCSSPGPAGLAVLFPGPFACQKQPFWVPLRALGGSAV